ncbi:MAG: TIGR01244 family sulfur transferase [Methylotenera sp.]
MATEQKEINFDELRASADKACGLMRVMANADRLMLLCQLSQGEKSVGELEEILQIFQPTLSQQLTVLREAELVSTRREGKNIFYSISSESALAVMQVLSQEICNSKSERCMTIQITEVTHDFSTAPQISVDDVADIAKLGFKTIVNNRPDNEGGAEQPTNAQLKAVAEKLGLNYVFIPVIPNNIQAEEITAFAAAYAAAAKPVLAFCRTGNRAGNIFKLAQAGV